MKRQKDNNFPHIYACSQCPYLRFNYGEEYSPYFETDSPICGFTGQPLKDLSMVPDWCPFKKEADDE